MTRTHDLLAVIYAAPDRIWTPTEVGAALGLPPEKVGPLMRGQMAEGRLVRSGRGRYHLPSYTSDRFEPGCRPSPLRGIRRRWPRTLPPLAPPVHAPDPADLILVVNALHAHGRPMSETLLINRLNRSGLKLAALRDILTALESGGQTQRTPERLWELTGVGL